MKAPKTFLLNLDTCSLVGWSPDVNIVDAHGRQGKYNYHLTGELRDLTGLLPGERVKLYQGLASGEVPKKLQEDLRTGDLSALSKLFNLINEVDLEELQTMKTTTDTASRTPSRRAATAKKKTSKKTAPAATTKKKTSKKTAPAATTKKKTSKKTPATKKTPVRAAPASNGRVKSIPDFDYDDVESYTALSVPRTVPKAEDTEKNGTYLCRLLMMGKFPDEVIVAAVHRAFPGCSTKLAQISWYRNKLKRDGTPPPARLQYK